MGVVGRWVVGTGARVAEASLHDTEAPGWVSKTIAHRKRTNPLVELTDVHTDLRVRGRGWSRVAVAAALAYADSMEWDVCLRVCVYGEAGYVRLGNKRLKVDALKTFYGSFGFKPLGEFSYTREMLRLWKPTP